MSKVEASDCMPGLIIVVVGIGERHGICQFGTSLEWVAQRQQHTVLNARAYIYVYI